MADFMMNHAVPFEPAPMDAPAPDAFEQTSQRMEEEHHAAQEMQPTEQQEDGQQEHQGQQPEQQNEQEQEQENLPEIDQQLPEHTSLDENDAAAVAEEVVEEEAVAEEEGSSFEGEDVVEVNEESAAKVDEEPAVASQEPLTLPCDVSFPSSSSSSGAPESIEEEGMIGNTLISTQGLLVPDEKPVVEAMDEAVDEDDATKPKEEMCLTTASRRESVGSTDSVASFPAKSWAEEMQEMKAARGGSARTKVSKSKAPKRTLVTKKIIARKTTSKASKAVVKKKPSKIIRKTNSKSGKGKVKPVQARKGKNIKSNKKVVAKKVKGGQRKTRTNVAAKAMMRKSAKRVKKTITKNVKRNIKKANKGRA